MSSLTAIASAPNAPCFSAFLLPLGAPPAAPCMRQTLDPRTAGARHWNPLRFDLAWHLNAWRISKSMGLFLRFSACPHPKDRGADVANHRFAAIGDMDMLHGHLLLAPRAIVFQRRDLGSKGASELVESAFG